MTDANRLSDAFSIALERANNIQSDSGVVGYGVVQLLDEHGNLKDVIPFANKITDNGDLYYAKRAIAGVAPAAAADATKVVNMQLGTGGATLESKSGAGSTIVTFISGSGQAFDASYPQTSNLGAGLGVQAVYKTTWAAGTATNSAINEAVITSQASATTAAAVADTISRVTFTAVNKGANDTLAITWNHKFLGA